MKINLIDWINENFQEISFIILLAFTAILFVIAVIKCQSSCDVKCRKEKPREIRELYKECVKGGGEYCLDESCRYYCDMKEDEENES